MRSVAALLIASLMLAAPSSASVFGDSSTPNITNAAALMLFGDGTDGDLVCTSTTALTTNKFYRNLTIGAGCSLSTTSMIFVAGVLDLSAAPACGITGTSTAGANASGTTGGTVGTAIVTGKEWSSPPTSGTAGVNGGTTTGTQGTTPSVTVRAQGGAAGASGAGGAGTSGAGGANRPLLPTAELAPTYRLMAPPLRGGNSLGGGVSGPSGGSGGGDGTAGGGSGPGGIGGSVIYVAARAITRTASTAAGAICSKGTVGGNGGTPAGGSRGSGGGGGGGGGGWIVITYGGLTGVTATNALDVSGGAGGSAGTPTGAGVSGDGGQGGGGGSIDVFNVGAGTGTHVVATALGGTAASGATGGAGEVSRLSL